MKRVSKTFEKKELHEVKPNFQSLFSPTATKITSKPRRVVTIVSDSFKTLPNNSKLGVNFTKANPEARD